MPKLKITSSDDLHLPVEVDVPLLPFKMKIKFFNNGKHAKVKYDCVSFDIPTHVAIDDGGPWVDMVISDKHSIHIFECGDYKIVPVQKGVH